MNAGLALEVSNVSYRSQQKILLSDISFSIAAGELVGIIGPNGAGKSTLLKTLCGYLKPFQGEIWTFGKTTRHLGALERARYISYMAQHAATGFALNVRETIGLGAYSNQIWQQVSETEFTAMLNRLIKQLNISHLANRKLSELSGGETQLVHFARILMQQAPVMLLDEPTASLDIGHEAELMNYLRAQCEAGSTALVAIHNLNTAAAFCDRLLLIAHGSLIDAGTPEQVLERGRLERIYRHPLQIARLPETGSLIVVPSRH